MLAAVNCNSWTAVIVSYVVVNPDSSIIADWFIAIDNNPLTVRNLARVGLVLVTDIILIVVNEVIVHKNLCSSAPITVGALDGNAAGVIWRPIGIIVDDIIVYGDVIARKHYSSARTKRDRVVAHDDMMNGATTADAVSICRIVLVGR